MLQIFSNNPFLGYFDVPWIAKQFGMVHSSQLRQFEQSAQFWEFNYQIIFIYWDSFFPYWDSSARWLIVYLSLMANKGLKICLRKKMVEAEEI